MLHFYLLFSFNISIEIIARDLLLQGTHFKGIVGPILGLGLYLTSETRTLFPQVFNFLT